MRYSELKQVIMSQFSQPGGNRVAYLIEGAPGGGKSALCRDIVRSLGGTDDNTVEFNASTRDPVDVLGTPNNTGDFTKWVPPEEFWKLRRGQGPCFLILEELSDAPMPMQNALCRPIYDRHAGQLPLSEELFILGSGNRTTDKSGAFRISTKLANRMRRHTLDVNLDDWVEWAQDVGNIRPEEVQYIRLRPEALMDWDSNREVNATPRSWESLNRIDTNLPPALYLAECAATVGDGRAAEWCAFLRIYQDLPSIEDVVMNPTGLPVPEKLDVQYALAGSLAHGTNDKTVDRIGLFVERLPVTLQTLYWLDSRKFSPRAVKGSSAYLKWATANANVILGRS